MSKKPVTYQDVKAARRRIQSRIYRTPLTHSHRLSTDHTSYYLKLESQQITNSFKVRGTLNKLSALAEKKGRKKVAAVSSGNHGAGLSYAASIMPDFEVVIFVPTSTPAAKIDKMQYYGADVRREGENFNRTRRIAFDFCRQNEHLMVDPDSDIEVIAGQGTIVQEVLDQNPAVDTIIVPVGGGGLITGIAVAARQLRPDITIVGVQTSACPAFVRAIEEDTFYETYPIEESICDGLVGGVGEIPFQMADDCIDEMMEVSEERIRKAVPFIIGEEKAVAEPAGAAGVAAVRENPYRFSGDEIAIIISGGNIDAGLIKELFNEVY
ncbi:threonine ammonia-lyase [Halarsenatibacter silvermanii]|uniref:threonine ammonia-lyase n=1 Tax=Halarsenatibacter silvermanii TaxID=321763 RepID=A0A1G9PHH4_9FIRM|nr:threonine/serine dehydratase [Halarsenatibacter silvermanii]SDL97931.1 threonine dehydratase [Halarsenatibacter silvermanii]